MFSFFQSDTIESTWRGLLFNLIVTPPDMATLVAMSIHYYALLIQLIDFETRRHKSLQSGKFGFLALVVKTMQLWGKSEIVRLEI